MEPAPPGYTLIRQLGRGGEGTVYLVALDKTKKREDTLATLRHGCDAMAVAASSEDVFAMKIRRCDGLGEANEALQEALAQARAAGKHNVRIEDAFLTKASDASAHAYSVHIVMEYHARGDLASFLHGGGQRTVLAPEEALEWTHQLLQGLHTLHRCGLVHRDLKPENVFVSEANVLRIGDLGLARSVRATGTAQGVEGSSAFMAPEVLAGQGATAKSDVFSLGCIVLELLNGESLCASRKVLAEMALEQKERWNPETLFSRDSLATSSPLCALAIQMLSADPAKRPAVTELLRAVEQIVASRTGLRVSGTTDQPADLSFAIRPLKKGEEAEAARVLARAYEQDPRFYYWTYACAQEKRRKITRQLMEAVVAGAAPQKAVWVAVALDRIVGCMIVMSPEDKKRPPLSALITSGWKLLKHTSLLLPGVRLYGVAMKEVDRVFPNQLGEWFVVNVGVEPCFQAQGIGGAMLGQVVQWADQQCTRINALVFHQRQVAFLERYGFQVVSVREEKDHPSFFTLARSVKRGSVRISARASVTLAAGDVAEATTTRASQVRTPEMSNSNNNNDSAMEEVDL
jgi:ribosomal protein S18 acetylase RimI-like enzyme